MIVQAANIAGAYVISPEEQRDGRGSFYRTWDAEEFAALGLETRVSQCSISRNPKAGTLRGLHYQCAPFSETKIVRCISGAIFDVIVDLRSKSPTYRHWFGATLSSAEGNSIYIPPGCAHGFQTLVDGCEVFYMIWPNYEPSAARTIRWDDPAFSVRWPFVKQRFMSKKDAEAPYIE